MDAATNLPNELQHLATQLAAEPCCHEHGLHTQSLAETGEWLKTAELTDSVSRFRAIFALFLAHLEQVGISGADILSTVRIADYLTEPVEEGTLPGRVLNLASHAIPATEDWAGPGSAKAREYYELATHLREHAASPAGEMISAEHLLRLEGLLLCFALELESQESLQDALRRFWPVRREALKGLLVGPRKDIAEPLQKEWVRAFMESGFWPYSGSVPLPLFRNSMCYLLASDKPEAPVPNLLEAGLWTYLFGQDLELNGIWLVDHFGLTSDEPARVSDAFVRLNRCYRFKALLNQPASVFTEGDRNELWDHVQKLFAFWSR